MASSVRASEWTKKMACPKTSEKRKKSRKLLTNSQTKDNWIQRENLLKVNDQLVHVALQKPLPYQYKQT